MRSFNRGNSEGPNSFKICFSVYMHYVSVWIDLRKGYLWEEFRNVCLLTMEFDFPEVTLCSWQDIKIQWLLTNV